MRNAELASQIDPYSGRIQHHPKVRNYYRERASSNTGGISFSDNPFDPEQLGIPLPSRGRIITTGLRSPRQKNNTEHKFARDPRMRQLLGKRLGTTRIVLIGPNTTTDYEKQRDQVNIRTMGNNGPVIFEGQEPALDTVAEVFNQAGYWEE